MHINIQKGPSKGAMIGHVSEGYAFLPEDEIFHYSAVAMAAATEKCCTVYDQDGTNCPSNHCKSFGSHCVGNEVPFALHVNTHIYIYI